MDIILPPQRQNIKDTAGSVLLSMAATARVCDFCSFAVLWRKTKSMILLKFIINNESQSMLMCTVRKFEKSYL